MVPVYLIQAGSLADLHGDLGVAGPFALLRVGDATGWDELVVGGLATNWIESGLAYACCWGDRSEWVHDLIDRADLAAGEQPGVVTTTWHDRQPLPEAVYTVTELALADEQRFQPIKSESCRRCWGA